MHNSYILNPWIPWKWWIFNYHSMHSTLEAPFMNHQHTHTSGLAWSPYLTSMFFCILLSSSSRRKVRRKPVSRLVGITLEGGLSEDVKVNENSRQPGVLRLLMKIPQKLEIWNLTNSYRSRTEALSGGPLRSIRSLLWPAGCLWEDVGCLWEDVNVNENLCRSSVPRHLNQNFWSPFQNMRLIKFQI